MPAPAKRAPPLAVTACTLCALACGPVSADSFRLVPTLSIQETLTNNVNLSPSGSAQGDLVTNISPGFTVSETGARVNLNGSVSAPILLYVNTGAENNQAFVQANLTGSVEAVEKFFFVEGAVYASPQYFTPFGAQPQGLANATNNRYQSALYRVSPYIRGGVPGDVEYVLRNDSIWSTLSGAPISTENSYTNQTLAHVGRQAAQLGWSLEYTRSSVKFSSQPALITQLGRLRLDHSPDPQLKLSVSGGYEDEDYTLSHSNGPIYGLGATWRPTDRTSVEALWEHRFFGASYLFNFNHRTPLSVWAVNASRNITSYPQQVATLPTGVDIPSYLNQLFLSTLPDPAARQAAVDQLINNRGLPTTLSSPVNLYTQQITLQEQASATVGLLGARNTVFLTAYYLKQQPITAAGNDVPGFAAALNNNTQIGATITWQHTLTSSLSLVTGVSVSQTESNLPESAVGFSATTRQGYATIALSMPLGPNTSINGGVRYQVSHVDFGTGYNEAAIFAGFNHTFH
jgi:uncharacterized protein (PEP-CTERM system associated)